jgi:CheY-like chemotaxis protein/nitrogen-specific signal transduction histidine kinase
METSLSMTTSLLAMFLAIACGYLFFKNWQARQLVKELLDQSHHLQSINQSKGEALSNISHEIRTPMSAILGAQERILRHHQLPSQDQKILASAHASAQSMLDILNQVLDLSKIESGNLELEISACDLKNLLKHIQRTFSSLVDTSRVKFEMQICPEITESLMMDGTRVGQVIHNLLSNAIKHTEDGEIILQTRVLANDHFGQMVYFEIADTGSGMSKEDIARVLQPYEQKLNEITKFSELGSGLGLPITTHLLKLMGSRLNIESAPKLGSTFSFTLALRRSVDHPKYGHQEIFESPLMPSTPSNKTVLIVDDHSPSRMITESQFLEMGYCVHGVSNAQEALELLKDHPFDLLITDLSMPHMNGLELAQKVRSLDGHSSIEIYGLTAHTQGAQELLSPDTPFDNVLIKPAGIQDWQREIHRKDHYLKSLQKLSHQDNKVCKIIAEEILQHQSQVSSELVATHINSIDDFEIIIKPMAHKIQGGAKLLNDLELCRVCERLQKNTLRHFSSHIKDLQISLNRSNRGLKLLLMDLN